ncbi:ComF family protein [Deinococcus radiophilus]|uniref:ComF family protein n=1 Tax=Deinococcus radiophilus TaxID=32062 RepID=A0A3S0KFX1_9DEIO|nr:ComF family protein [Deinococcus radiophilus]RTR25815.1 ComF family protein [Deinococcus radiophilus]UFA50861.1 ComF family protein [Deinococcus radiophilus]
MALREQLGALLRLALPRACPGCGAQLGSEAGLCIRCRSQLRPHTERYSLLSPGPVPHLVSLGRYQGPVRRTVRALKYGQAREVAEVLGTALASAIPNAWQIVGVVPVPLHPLRERERGFNQAALLAEAIADTLQVPYAPQALQRVRRTQQQAKLSGDQRRQNVSGAFVADASQLSEGAVLLVDDVLTTGSTLLACRDALRAQGVEDFYYAVAAH